jgi:hypothetical protein
MLNALAQKLDKSKGIRASNKNVPNNRVLVVKKLLIYILLALAAIIPASAQDVEIEHQLVVDIPFVLRGNKEKDICTDRDNSELEAAFRHLRAIAQDSTIVIKAVEFYSSVSPEGSYTYNKTLSKKRLETAERIIRSYIDIPASAKVTRTERMIPWTDYLLPIITADTTKAYRNELIKLIIENERSERRRALQNDSKLWDMLERDHFKHMRKAGAIITTVKIIYSQIAQSVPTAIASVKAVDATAMSFPREEKPAEVAEPIESKLGVSLKTNLVMWGLGITNVAVEFDLCKHLSLSVPVMYAAYNYFKPTIKFRTLATQPELRYWIKKENTGFFVGAHFGVGSYNIAVDKDTRYQDHNGTSPALGGGLTVGYRTHISKNKRWSMEFLVGAGCYKLHYDTFYNVDNGRLFGTHKKTYWGVDNAAINFNYKFDYKKKQQK